MVGRERALAGVGVTRQRQVGQRAAETRAGYGPGPTWQRSSGRGAGYTADSERRILLHGRVANGSPSSA